MRAVKRLHRFGIGIAPEQTAAEAAQIMERAGVGTLAVIDKGSLVGIVTDRDLVRRVMARDLPLDVRIDSVMSTPVVTIDASADLHEALDLFRTHALRRLPVVNGSGRFLGMISLDDLLIDLAGDLTSLIRPMNAEIHRAHRDSPLPTV